MAASLALCPAACSDNGNTVAIEKAAGGASAAGGSPADRGTAGGFAADSATGGSADTGGSDTSGFGGSAGTGGLDTSGFGGAAAIGGASRGGPVMEDAGSSLCNGADGARLVVFFGGGEIGARMVIVSAGRSLFLLVDGDCDYWARQPTASEITGPHMAWAEVRRGHLDAAMADAIAKELRFAEWEVLAGDHSEQGGGGDIPVFYLDNGEYRIECSGGCEGELAEIQDAAFGYVEELYRSGHPEDGPIAVGAWLADDPELDEGVAFIEAVDGLDLESIAEAMQNRGEDNLPVGVVVSDPEVTSWLRSERAEMTIDPDRPSFIPLQSKAGERYEVYFRDLTPHEEPDGTFVFAKG